MTRSTPATPRSDSRRWSTSSTRTAIPRRPDASLTSSMRLSCTPIPAASPPAMAVDESSRAVARRDQTPDQGHGPLRRQGQLPHSRLGGARPVDHPPTNGMHFNELGRQRITRLRYEGIEQTPPRRCPPHRLTHREPRPRRICSSKRDAARGGAGYCDEGLAQTERADADRTRGRARQRGLARRRCLLVGICVAPARAGRAAGDAMICEPGFYI